MYNINRISLNKGEYILIKGPAYIKVLDGTIEIFGAKLHEGKSTYVVIGRQIPISTLYNSVIEIRLGSEGSYKMINKDPIPNSWKKAARELLNMKGFKALVIGDIDVGKSSFTLYIANILSSNNLRIGIIDSDIGQSDIGPPGTIGLGILDKPVYSYSEIKLCDAYFIGDKTPSGHLLPMVLGTMNMVNKAFKYGVDGVIINTTGLVYGGIGRVLKKYKIEAIEPSHIYVIMRENELKNLIRYLGIENRVRYIETPSNILKKKRSYRREFRKIKMDNFFNPPKNYTYRLDDLKIENTILGAVSRDEYTLKNVYNLIGLRPVASYIDRDDIYLIFNDILSKTDYLKIYNKLKDKFNNIRIISLNKLKGLLIGLYDDNGFIGVGRLFKIDLNKRIIKFTSRESDKIVKRIIFGYLILDDDFNEIGSMKPGYI